MAVAHTTDHLPRRVRLAVLERFRARAAELVKGGARSVLLAVAVRNGKLVRHIIASPRDVPLWPHVCNRDGEDCEVLHGGDARGFSDLPHWDYADEMASHVPFAIARPGADAVMLDRTYGWAREDLMAIPLPPPLDWLADGPARRLYDEVCANVADDEPRLVLADYLLEHGFDHGEVVSLGIAKTLDEDAYQRHETLLRQDGPRWIGPLLHVIPAAGAHFRRGFLWRAEVCAPDPGMRERTRGAAAWGTLEQLRVLQPSPGFALDPAMVALREVAMLDGASLGALLERPWNIERLGIRLAADDLARLARASTLPRLRHLHLAGPDLEAIAYELPRAAWWRQLETLELTVETRELWFGRATALAADGPRVLVDRRRCGWQLAFGRERGVVATMLDFDRHASRAELRGLAGRLADPVSIAPSPFFSPRPGDL